MSLRASVIRADRAVQRCGLEVRPDDRAVGAQAKGVSGTRRHRDDILPTADVALPVAVVSGCEDRGRLARG
jgi:hypothetical protein